MSAWRVIEGPETIFLFLEVAALDRLAWGDAPETQFVPDGEHAWRVWAEHSYLAVAVGAAGEVVGALVGFDTRAGGHFAHKLFADPSVRSEGVGTLLMERYCAFLDRENLASMFTTAPWNSAVLSITGKLGFSVMARVPEFYGPGKDRLVLGREPRRPAQA